MLGPTQGTAGSTTPAPSLDASLSTGFFVEESDADFRCMASQCSLTSMTAKRPLQRCEMSSSQKSHEDEQSERSIRRRVFCHFHEKDTSALPHPPPDLPQLCSLSHGPCSREASMKQPSQVSRTTPQIREQRYNQPCTLPALLPLEHGARMNHVKAHPFHRFRCIGG